MSTSLISVRTLEEIVSEVHRCSQIGKQVLPVGNGTKPHLSRAVTDEIQRISLVSWAGVLEYQPFEFTITAKSGTQVIDIQRELEAKGQYLPFDPIFAQQGATLGGTIATGVSGPGRLLFGGIRDFILGVQFVDGLGQVVRGGGKVVKNAAGFDLPKMMVGSLGRLGILSEITLKVFPKPIGYRTLTFNAKTTSNALNQISRLMLLPIDIVAVELASDRRVHIRVAGDEATTTKLTSRIRSHLSILEGEEWSGEQDSLHWTAAAELAWAKDADVLVRVPLTMPDIEKLDRRLEMVGAKRWYSAAANAAWVAVSGIEQRAQLEIILCEVGLKGLVLRGEGALIIGRDTTAAFASRIQRAIDPANVFAAY